MSALGEKTLIAHLVDPEAVGIIATEGLDPEAIPTAELRPIVAFAVDYFFASGCQKAPSVAVLKAEFSDALNDAEIDIDTEPDDSVEWAIGDLKATHVYQRAMRFNKNFASEMSDVPKDQRIGVVNQAASELVGLAISMESRAYRTELRDRGAPDIIRRYESRAAAKGEFRGMGVGLQAIDTHTYGIHPGELAILAAGPKTGKSFWQCWVALREFERGRRVALFTLENSVEMMLDRIACMACVVDAQAWERGEATEQEIDRVRSWVEDVMSGRYEGFLHVHKPDIGQRSFQSMVREAELLGAHDLLIDQLTFVELGQGIGDHRAKNEKIGEGLHILKNMISTGRHQMSCLLTHQINREGVKSADKVGHLEMWHLAEGAECERTADFIFGQYGSHDERAVGQAKFQMLGARRVELKHWQIGWRPWTGMVKAKQEIELSE